MFLLFPSIDSNHILKLQKSTSIYSDIKSDSNTIHVHFWRILVSKPLLNTNIGYYGIVPPLFSLKMDELNWESVRIHHTTYCHLTETPYDQIRRVQAAKVEGPIGKRAAQGKNGRLGRLLISLYRHTESIVVCLLATLGPTEIEAYVEGRGKLAGIPMWQRRAHL